LLWGQVAVLRARDPRAISGRCARALSSSRTWFTRRRACSRWRWRVSVAGPW